MLVPEVVPLKLLALIAPIALILPDTVSLAFPGFPVDSNSAVFVGYYCGDETAIAAGDLVPVWC